jgi:flagellar assembly factor FliW
MTSSASSDTSVIRLNTQFGDFEAEASNLITFPEGLPGFERCRRFVLLRHSGASLLTCLHAVDGPMASFLAVDPRHVLPHYRCELSETHRFRLGAGSHVPLVWLAVITIGEHDELYVNLRAPVVISPEHLLGLQVMPHNALYPLRHRLDLEELSLTGTDGASCSW